MLTFLVDVLRYLGATRINIVFMEEIDPTTEEEFKKIDFLSDNPITWSNYLEGLEKYKKETFLRELRIKRNFLLSKTDWIMTVDNFESLQNKEEWKSYRQQLRDITNIDIPITFSGNKPIIDETVFPPEPKIIRS